MQTQNSSKKQAAKDTVVFVIAAAVLAVAEGACACLLVLFFCIDYLPTELLVILRILCVAAMLLSIGFFRAYLETRG